MGQELNCIFEQVVRFEEVNKSRRPQIGLEDSFRLFADVRRGNDVGSGQNSNFVGRLIDHRDAALEREQCFAGNLGGRLARYLHHQALDVDSRLVNGDAVGTDF